jgi:hypothetical protein
MSIHADPLTVAAEVQYRRETGSGASLRRSRDVRRHWWSVARATKARHDRPAARQAA